MLDPVPADVPPQDPVNHCQVAPAPRLPPATVRVLDVPLHVLLFVIVTPAGEEDKLPTETARVIGVLVPQVFDATTLISPF